MTKQTSQRSIQILVLGGPQAGRADFLAALPQLGEIRVVSNIDEALGALRERPYDVVISELSSFLPLAHAAGRQQTEAILENIGQGVCTVARDGRLISANARLRSYPEAAIEAVRKSCTALCRQFISIDARPEQRLSRRTYLDVSGGLCFDITASPVFDASDQVTQVVAIVSDNTSARRLQDKINAIDAAGGELVRLDTEALAKMDVGERLALLEDKIIRYTRDLMHFDHFCIRVLDRSTNRLDTVLASGMSDEAKNLTLCAVAEGNGISGFVAARGRSYISPDVTKDSRYLPGIDHARSSLTVPLRLHDQIIGILNVESERIAAFDEDDRQFAEIFGRYVAMALHILQLLAAERWTATGQIASDVSMELAGPLNDIVTDVTTLMEDYIGHDDLRHRLSAIVDNIDLVKRTLANMTDAGAVQGVTPEQAEHDPILADKRILVADDEDLIRETIAEVLTKYGARVVMAADGSEAIAAVARHKFDLVLSDIKMPDRNGYEVFSVAKKKDPHCPVILITGFGYDPNHSIVRASQEGLAAVLFKPFKVEQLLEDVRHALTTHVL
jgi:CheY-like chemotaxis protein